MDGVAFVRDLAVVMVVAGAAGWLCRRIGLSVVVGYLAAGIIVGPYTPPFALVTDLDRVQELAQFGLVFLIFSVGLGLSIGRLKRLGASIALATGIGALLVLQAARLFAAALGWSQTEGLFLAGMLMVSSSAIIAKVLEEQQATHEREGQLALGITVLEDVVAIVMLTVLTSLARTAPAGADAAASAAPLGPTLLRLGAFVVALAVAALLAVPWLLRRLSRGPPELRTVVLAGLVLGAAVAAALAGFSLALGAFVLGAIVAGTRFRPEAERAFESMKDVFGAVFFVAIGMLFDVRLLAGAWPLVLAVTLLVVLARPLACALGLLAVGNPNRTAVKAALTLLPIGEFSLVMAQLGVSARLVPESFYAVAVGICLTTSLVAPAVTRRADAIADVLVRLEPRFVRAWIEFYQARLAGLHRRQAASLAWKLTNKRILQVGVQLLLVTALLLAWRLVQPVVDGWAAGPSPVPGWAGLASWGLLALVLAAPLYALWRNVEAILMILTETATGTGARALALRPLVLGALKFVTAAALALWVLSLLPLSLASWEVRGLMVGVLVVTLVLFSRRLLRWHIQVELQVREQVRAASSPAAASGLSLPVLERPGEWDIEVAEVELPAQSEHAGRRLRDLALRSRVGCSVAGIDRQGCVITNPGADERLFPGDRLLLLGTEAQLAQGTALLLATDGGAPAADSFGELTTETVQVPPAGAAPGATLQQLDLIGRFGVQVCGVARAGERRVMPSGKDRIAPGDRLLLLGTHDRIAECRDWLEAGGLARAEGAAR